MCCFLNVFQCETIYFYFLSWFLPACFLHLAILCFHYPGSHRDQICDAATKASKDQKIKFAQVNACHGLSGICSERIFNVRVICNMKCHYYPPKCTLTAVPLTAPNLQTHLERFQNAHSNINQLLTLSVLIIIQGLKSVSGRWISMCQQVHLPLFFLSWWCERVNVKSPSIFVTFPLVLSPSALALSKDTSKIKYA